MVIRGLPKQSPIDVMQVIKSISITARDLDPLLELDRKAINSDQLDLF